MDFARKWPSFGAKQGVAADPQGEVPGCGGAGAVGGGGMGTLSDPEAVGFSLKSRFYRCPLARGNRLRQQKATLLSAITDPDFQSTTLIIPDP